MSKKISAVLSVAVFLYLGILAFQLSQKSNSTSKVLKVLSYSSFLAEWGPGKELAVLFEKKSGIKVEYHDGEDAGLLLSKLELFPSDLILGLDQLSLHQAKQKQKWRTPSLQNEPRLFDDDKFVAFDWAPLTFIYRQGEVEPPRSIDDLLDSRFKYSISLEDPRTSTPGLQFLFWVIQTKGEAQGFEFLKKLKPNIRSVSPSWSTAYGLFQKSQAKLVYSYQTSPVYHWVNEKDFKIQPAYMTIPVIAQAEYAGVPDNCSNCEGASEFIKFLLTPEAQKIIMQKNVMMPILPEVLNDTEFAKLHSVQLIDKEQLEKLSSRKQEFLDKWKELEL